MVCLLLLHRILDHIKCHHCHLLYYQIYYMNMEVAIRLHCHIYCMNMDGRYFTSVISSKMPLEVPSTVVWMGGLQW